MKVNLKDPRAVCLLLLSTLTIMSNATIAPALPGLANEFSQTPNSEILVKMLIPIPALLVVIFAPILGWTADKFGRRNQLIIATAAYAISGAAGAWLQDLEAIIVSRAILGICVAALMTAVTALVADYYSGPLRGQFMGLQQAFINIGGIAFIVTGGFIAGINARLPFYIYAIAIALVPLVIYAIRETKHTEHHSQNAEAPTDNSWKLPLAGCAVLLFWHLVVFYVLPTQIPFFMEDIGIADPSKAGLAIGMGTLAGAIAGVWFGKLVAKLKGHGVVFLGFLAMSLAMLVLSFATTFALVVIGCGLMGVCMGFVMPNFMLKGMELVPSNKRGLASGLLTSSIFIGQFVSPLLSTALIESFDYSGFYRITAVFALGLAVVSATFFKKHATQA